jgi:hypothetical protein
VLQIRKRLSRTVLCESLSRNPSHLTNTYLYVPNSKETATIMALQCTDSVFYERLAKGALEIYNMQKSYRVTAEGNVPTICYFSKDDPPARCHLFHKKTPTTSSENPSQLVSILKSPGDRIQKKSGMRVWFADGKHLSPNNSSEFYSSLAAGVIHLLEAARKPKDQGTVVST